MVCLRRTSQLQGAAAGDANGRGAVKIVSVGDEVVVMGVRVRPGIDPLRPPGFFKGLAGLDELNLSGNFGTPFTLAMELA